MERETFSGKIRGLLVFLGIVFLILIGRLGQLQLIDGEKNLQAAEENRVRRQFLPAGRGIFYDRQGRPLVENVPFYRLLGEEGEYRPVEREEALTIEAVGGETAERLRLDIGRHYMYGESLAHLLGYVGQAREKEVEEWFYLKPGDLVGREGVEQENDFLLRGKRGEEIFEVDAEGRKLRTIGQVEPQAGEDLFLSVDAVVCQAGFEALGGQPGAIVATEAKTGKIICLTSSPSFDPDRLSRGLKKEEYAAILNDPLKPFFNRALGGSYPPGSTFKMVTAAAGLEEKVIGPESVYTDTGLIRVGEFSFRNWYYTQYGRTEGEINLSRALTRSTDTFFYDLGGKLGPEKLAAWARRFGLGEKTGVNLPGEIGGLVPDPEWKQKNRGEGWFLGNTYHMAIGQADLMATPLQINALTGVIANEGKWCPPKVGIKGKKDGVCREVGLSEETLKTIKEGMIGACSAGGTAFPFFDFEPRVACKTGTAQFGDPEDRTHAWLTAFAPAEAPEIVVTVLMEAGGEGSRDAAPVAKVVLEAWFKGKDEGKEEERGVEVKGVLEG